MLFNSIEFLIFLPIVLALYWLLGGRLRVQNAFVVVASYFFYGWWDWRFLLLIAFTSLCSYLSGILSITKTKTNTLWRNRLVCGTNIVINLLVLCLFKYYNFFVDTFVTLFPALCHQRLLLNVILPVGISFYTFQALSYSIDVYRRKIEPTRDIIAFFAYVSFFPQLVAGPIERATNLLPQMLHKRSFDYSLAVDGLRQMLWGFFKKMVVADGCARYVDTVFADHSAYGSSTLLLAAVFFSFQIYGDFSGYSDIAIGTAKLFGIRLKRNFNVPYFSRDIAEFWRRWHISLTTWFRDYLYIPLGGSRVSKAKVLRNTFIIFLISGLWHGANWTFLVWGAYHALLFLPLVLLGRNRRHTDIVASGRWLPSFRESMQMIGTFSLAVIGWIIFRAESVGQAANYIKAIFTPSPHTSYLIPHTSYIFIVVMLCVEWLTRTREHGLEISNIPYRWLRWTIYYTLAFSIFLFSYQSEAFIYFQF